jgi:hypothetical protein
MATSKKLIIHVGAPKTGTTAIQNELFGTRDSLFNQHGILYPKAGIKVGQRGHHNLVYEIAPFHRAAGKFDTVRGGWFKVLNEIKSREAQTTIVSAEGLLRRAPKVSRLVGKAFRPFDVEVVIYLRRQDEYLESGYNQLARFGRVEDDFENFIVRRANIVDYKSIVQKWQECLPSAKIICRPFERRIIGNNVVADFTKVVLGIENFQTAAVTSNLRAGLKSIQAAKALKACVSTRVGKEYVLSAQVANQIRQLFTQRFEDLYDFSFSSLETSQRLLAQAESTNRWLASQFPGFDPEFFFSMDVDESRKKPLYREVAFTAEEAAELELITEQVVRAHRGSA